jgi:hypothetical protein
MTGGSLELYKATPLVSLLMVTFITRAGHVDVSCVKTLSPLPVDGGTNVESLNKNTENPTCRLIARIEIICYRYLIVDIWFSFTYILVFLHTINIDLSISFEV